ncbi:MAG: O-antigen ligase family protein [Candidatus Zixiibacteriota bacterium]
MALIGLRVMTYGITVNQSLAMILALTVLGIWSFNKVHGLIAGLIFFVVKPVIVRAAFAVDLSLNSSGGLDLLGMTPAVLLAVLIVWQIYSEASSGKRLMQGRTRTLLTVLVGLSLLSVLNPASSIMVGLGGFERNILPNMMILFAVAYLLGRLEDTDKFVKSLLLLGVVSCIYAIGQYWLGLYSWEKDWMRHVAFKDSMNGWLTIGLRGVEFRIFSVFYNYMDFTFSNVLVFSLVLAWGRQWKGGWNVLRRCYFACWAIVLVLTLERTPMLMTAVGAFAIYYLSGSPVRRKVLIWTAGISTALVIGGLNIAAPHLKNTGADKFIRLAELANPFQAGSIQDRVERKWAPTLEIIAANPLGVGIGFGSQTKVNDVARQSDYWVEPHNEILQKTLETGIAGGLVYLLLLISVFQDSRRLLRCSGNIGRLGMGMIAATLGYWLCGMVNIPFSGASGILYWTTAGVVIAAVENNHAAAEHLTNDRTPSTAVIKQPTNGVTA